jgi:hypothetical protein
MLTRLTKPLMLLSAALLLLINASLQTVSVSAQTPTKTPPTPLDMLLSYYTAINLRDYNTAYELWVNPTQTLDNFSKGFSDTVRVEPYFGPMQIPAGVAAEAGRVPSVLLGYHTDGTVVSYYGCFSIGYNLSSGNYTDYRIVDAKFSQLADYGALDSDSIAKYLSINCYSVAKDDIVKFIDQSGYHAKEAFNMMHLYYDAVNRRDYAGAYAMWLQPKPGPKPNGAPGADYRLPYTQFVNGYQNTRYVYIYLAPYDGTGASAGHSYLDGLQPAVLVGQNTDGTVQAYYGCYVIGGLSQNVLGIVSGSFQPFPATVQGTPDGLTILQALKTDCTTLPLQY